jgi:hypothetical protein
VVKHVDAVELLVVVAAVPAVAANAIFVAHHLLKLGDHLVTALARLHVLNLARRISLEAGSTRENKSGEEWGGGDAVAAGDKQLGSCTAGKRKNAAFCEQPRGDVPSASWNRWP